VTAANAASVSHTSSRGAVALLSASFVFAVMGVLVKLAAAQGIPAAEAAFGRMLFGLALVAGLRRVGAVRLETERRGMLITRGLLGVVALLFFYASLGGTSLANATLLSNTYFIFGPIVSAFLLRERPSARSAVAIPVALAGVWIVINPQLGGVRWGDVAGLLSGMIAGFSIVTIRDLRRTESSLIILWYLCLVGSVVTAVLMLEGAVLPTAPQLLLLLGIAGLGTFAQLLLNYGFKDCSVAAGTLLSLTTILHGMLLGHWIFGEPLTARFAWGGALVLAGAGWSSWSEAREPTRATVVEG
jgi:drug/metabolite transporter (DMT)-like permease